MSSNLLSWGWRSDQGKIAVRPTVERVRPKILRGVVDAQVCARLAVERGPCQHAIHIRQVVIWEPPVDLEVADCGHILHQQIAQLQRGVGGYVQDGWDSPQIQHRGVSIHCKPDNVH